MNVKSEVPASSKKLWDMLGGDQLLLLYSSEQCGNTKNQI